MGFKAGCCCVLGTWLIKPYNHESIIFFHDLKRDRNRLSQFRINILSHVRRENFSLTDFQSKLYPQFNYLEIRNSRWRRPKGHWKLESEYLRERPGMALVYSSLRKVVVEFLKMDKFQEEWGMFKDQDQKLLEALIFRESWERRQTRGDTPVNSKERGGDKIIPRPEKGQVCSMQMRRWTHGELLVDLESGGVGDPSS